MRRTLGLLLALQAAYWVAHAGVNSTNFAGIDEWPVIDLASRGVVSFPYANRLLSLVWVVPAHWLTPNDLVGFRLLSGLYVSLTGLLVFFLCRRLAPDAAAGRAFLAGAFSMLWAPTDSMRISTVQGTVHLGFAFGATCAIALFVESWARRSRWLLAAAAAMAAVTILSYEAVLPLLLAAPLLLPLRERETRPFAAAWTMVVVVAAVIALWPGAGHSHEYQAGLGADLRPALVGVRLVTQYWLHLAPLLLFQFPTIGFTTVIPVIAITAGVFMTRREHDTQSSAGRLLLIGLVGAGLAYAPYTLSPGVVGATRTQIVSAPWIGIFLASLIDLVTRRFGAARSWMTVVMAGWIALLGASHVRNLQAVWNRLGSFPAQRSSLSQLFATVPDVTPHTLILLVGETRNVWPMTFGFRHAMGYFYEDRAAGMVAGGDSRPYPATFSRDGIAVTPWPEIREVWKQPLSVYGYDEIVVVRLSPTGTLEVLPEWPADGMLPATPRTSEYRPFARIVPLSRPIPARSILE